MIASKEQNEQEEKMMAVRIPADLLLRAKKAAIDARRTLQEWVAAALEEQLSKGESQ